MKLNARIVPYSSIVGGGLTLNNEQGAACFMVMFRGTTQGINKEQSEALAKRISFLINTHGLDAPDSSNG